MSSSGDSGDPLHDEPFARAGDPAVVQRVFDQLPLMVCAVEGPELRFTAATRAYRTYAGRETITGTPFHEAYPEVMGQRIAELFERVASSGQSESLREWRVQFELPDSGGEIEAFVDLEVWPVRDARGEVTGIICQVADVTGRVQDRQAARLRVELAEQSLERARDIIDVLQRELLPASLPVLPSCHVAASYLLAEAGVSAGGDWFDAVVLTGGRVALVVGDVVGHGVAASAAMAQLRAVLHDRLDENGDLLGAVAAVDRLARRVRSARAATVCVLVLDPSNGAVEYCSAGHPPPLIAGPDGARFLPASGQGPLGTGARYTTATGTLDTDEVVVLYTDGIVERPGRAPSAATVELAQAVDDAVAGRIFAVEGGTAAERACTEPLELLVRQSGHSDDITLIAAQRRDVVVPLRLDVDPGEGWPGRVRTAVDRWVIAQHGSDDDRVALSHIAVELVTNSVEHALVDDQPLQVSIEASLTDDGEAWLAVSDNGRWRQPSQPGTDQHSASGGDGRHRGRGLAMTRIFVDALDVDRTPGGTTVTARRRMSRLARLLSNDTATLGGTAASRPRTAEFYVENRSTTETSRIAVHGPLDVSTAPDLGMQLDRYTFGGTQDLVVDLTNVTHLASAAVSVFFRAQSRRSTDDGRHHQLTLYAPAGSIAQHVLSLVDLPHTTTDPDSTDPDMLLH